MFAKDGGIKDQSGEYLMGQVEALRDLTQNPNILLPIAYCMERGMFP